MDLEEDIQLYFSGCVADEEQRYYFSPEFRFEPQTLNIIRAVSDITNEELLKLVQKFYVYYVGDDKGKKVHLTKIGWNQRIITTWLINFYSYGKRKNSKQNELDALLNQISQKKIVEAIDAFIDDADKKLAKIKKLDLDEVTINEFNLLHKDLIPFLDKHKSAILKLEIMEIINLFKK